MARRFETALVAAVVAFVALVLVLGWVDRSPTRQPMKQSGPLVVVAAPGLTWDQVTPQNYPQFHEILSYDDIGAFGTITPRGGRTGTCTTEAWASVSAGQGVRLPDAACTTPPAVKGTGKDARIDGWSTLRKESPQLGMLAQAYRDKGMCVQGIGPRAALAAADEQGRVGRYSPSPKGAKITCPLSFVDASDGTGRTTAAQLDAAFELVPADSTVLVTGLSDGRTAQPSDARLRMVYAIGPAVQHGVLGSTSVRQQGVIGLPDITATALDRIGAEGDGDVHGSPLAVGPTKDRSSSLVSQAKDIDAKTQASYRTAGWFMAGWVLFLLALAAWLWVKRAAVPAALPPLLTFAAAIPAASFLAMLAPWWLLPWPLGLTLATAFFAGVVTAIAHAGRWRLTATGPAIVVGTATWVVLAADVMTGARLQFSAPLGLQPLNGGRFFGMGNVGLAIFAVGGLVAAGLGAAHLVDLGERRRAALLVGLVGFATVVIDGWPGWGADFGGVPAVAVATFALVLLVLRVRPSARVVGLGVLAAVLAAGLLAVVDWLRPAESRTHLGTFVQQVIDGEAWDVVWSKLGANVELTFTTPASPLVPLVLVTAAVLLARPESRFGAPLDAALRRVTLGRETAVAVVTLLGAGYLVNDSGWSLAAIGLATSGGLAGCVVAGFLRREQDTTIRL